MFTPEPDVRYENGETVHVKVLPPPARNPKDSVVLEISYYPTTFGVEKADFTKEPTVPLNIEDNAPRIARGIQGQTPDTILVQLNFYPEREKKDYREAVVRIPFQNVDKKGKQTPARVMVRRPSHTFQTQPLFVTPRELGYAYVAVQVHQKKGPVEPDMGVWNKTAVVAPEEKPVEFVKAGQVKVKFLAPDRLWPGDEVKVKRLGGIPEGVRFKSAAVRLDPREYNLQASDPIAVKLPLPDNGREEFVQITLINANSGTIVPTAIYCPPPADPAKPVQVREVKAGENQAEFFHVLTLRDKSAQGSSLLPRISVHRYISQKRYVEYERSDYLILEYYGLVELTPTGKWNDWNSDKPEDQWYEVTLTELGEKYLIPKEQLGTYEASDMQQVMPKWENKYDEFTGGVDGPKLLTYPQEVVNEYKALEKQRERMSRYYKDGETVFIGILDGVAIKRDLVNKK